MIIAEFHGNFHMQRRELKEWIEKHKDSFYSDTDTGDYRTYGFYLGHTVFPLNDGRLVWVELMDSKYNMNYVIHTIEKADIDKRVVDEMRILKNVRGM